LAQSTDSPTICFACLAGVLPLEEKVPNQAPAGDAWEKLRISSGTNQIKRNKKSHLLIKMA